MAVKNINKWTREQCENRQVELSQIITGARQELREIEERLTKLSAEETAMAKLSAMSPAEEAEIRRILFSSANSEEVVGSASID